MFLREEVRPRLREMFPERRVILRPTTSTMMFFQMEGPKISQDVTDQIAAMPEVAMVHRQLSANFPVSANFDIETFNVGFSTDVILLGVDKMLVEDSIGSQFVWPPHDGNPIPVIVSEYFVDAYNLGFAESANLPKLSPNAVKGVSFDLLFGESTLDLAASSVEPEMRSARIAGLTDNPTLFGLTIPIETLIEYNKKYQPHKPVAYSTLHVDLASPEGAEAVEAKATELKIGFEAQREKLARYLQIVLTLEAILASALSVVLALAGIGIFTTTAASVRERRPAWGLHRATGLGRFGVFVLATGHALTAAIPAGIAACLLSLGVSVALTNTFGSWLEQLTIISANPFALGLEVYAAIMISAAVLALIPAWLFALPIMAAQPISLLSEKSL